MIRQRNIKLCKTSNDGGIRGNTSLVQALQITHRPLSSGDKQLTHSNLRCCYDEHSPNKRVGSSIASSHPFMFRLSPFANNSIFSRLEVRNVGIKNENQLSHGRFRIMCQRS